MDKRKDNGILLVQKKGVKYHSEDNSVKNSYLVIGDQQLRNDLRAETNLKSEGESLDNMIGNANMFIEGMNNFLTRFPKLRLDPAYIPRTLSVIEAVRDYLNEVEKDLLDALNTDNPQSEQE